MSARYSSSPALHLKIGESRCRARLYVALCLATSCALAAISVRGHALLALLLVPATLALLWAMRRDAAVGTDLTYQQGLWHLQRGATRRRITPTKRSAITAAVIYLAFAEQPSGRAGHVWLFSDSSSAQEIRRLRVRLTLLR